MRAASHELRSGTSGTASVTDATAVAREALRGVAPSVNRSSLLMTFDYSDTVEPIGQPPGGVLTERRYLRGIFDGQFKFARYFATCNMPTTWEQLLANNDLELYNLAADPEERNNLAQTPDAYRPIIESLNTRLNTLIQSEAGGEFPPGTHP